MKGREALKIDWDDSARREALMRRDHGGVQGARPERRAVPRHDRGDAAQALSGAAKVIEAEFEFPYLAHASMEPLNGTIERNGGRHRRGLGRLPVPDRRAGDHRGDPRAQAREGEAQHVWAGGSFGRRATPNADYLAETGDDRQGDGGKAPIHLVWTREDDMKGGYYRPMVYHRSAPALDADGNIVGWEHVDRRASRS